MTLDELRVGQEARIVDITLGGAIGQRWRGRA
jgi:Fe2+ transport system protein FeoA